LSGSVVVLNIIGLERVRNGGAKIRDAVPWDQVFSIPAVLMGPLRIVQHNLNTPNIKEEPEYIKESGERDRWAEPWVFGRYPILNTQQAGTRKRRENNSVGRRKKENSWQRAVSTS